MLNMMITNCRNERLKEWLTSMLKVQIHNSLDLGWKVDQIIVLSNFPYEYMGVKAIEAPLNDICLTGSKMFGLRWIFEEVVLPTNVVIWSHDLDAWQNAYFDEPEFLDVGAAQYSNRKYNGGSIFWKANAKDIVNRICDEITNNSMLREEPALDKIFKSKEYRDRITTLNNTYNVGCSGYVPRVQRSEKPIKVCHFHPDNRIAWELHTLDRDQIGEIGVTIRLERLIRSYYPNRSWKLMPRQRKAA